MKMHDDFGRNSDQCDTDSGCERLLRSRLLILKMLLRGYTVVLHIIQRTIWSKTCPHFSVAFKKAHNCQK